MNEVKGNVIIGWELVFSIFFCALLLGYGAGEVRSELATVPDEFLIQPSNPKPKPPKPAKPRPQEQPSSEDGDSGSSSASSQSSSGRFSKDGQGIIKDKQTGLQWYVGPNSDTNWNQAQSWAQSLSAGGGGWRMPTLSELRALNGTGETRYIWPRDAKEYIARIDPIFNLQRCCVWSSYTRDSSSAWYFFFYGGEEDWDFLENGHGTRAFAVRSR